MKMRIHVTEPRALDRLARTLARAGCVVERSSHDVVEVGAPSQLLDEAPPSRETELELRFFLRAWESENPGVRARLLT